MAQRITVRNDQNMLDIALRYYGDISAALTIAQLNGLSITDPLPPGTELLIGDGVIDADILAYYEKEMIQPSTGSPDELAVEVPEGIGYWAIGLDFIVS